jgi:hypothetical protein
MHMHKLASDNEFTMVSDKSPGRNITVNIGKIHSVLVYMQGSYQCLSNGFTGGKDVSAIKPQLR